MGVISNLLEELATAVQSVTDSGRINDTAILDELENLLCHIRSTASDIRDRETAGL